MSSLTSTKDSNSVTAIASQIHQAIRDHNLTVLPSLISDENKAILWHPNAASGWTALHFAVSHFLPLEWLEWLLRKSVVSANNSIENSREELARHQLGSSPFFTVQTTLGQTVLDVFFSSYWNPLPWQSTAVKMASTRLYQAVSVVSNHTVLQQALWDALFPAQKRTQRLRDKPLRTRTRTRQPLLATAVHRVQRFLTRLMAVCRAANHVEEESSSPVDTNQDPRRDSLEWMLRVLACNGKCPAEITSLIILLDQLPLSRKHNEETRDNHLPTPLEIWTACTTHRDGSSDPDPMLPALVKRYYYMSPKRNETNSILSRAVLSGKSWNQIEPLLHSQSGIPSTCFSSYHSDCLPVLAALSPVPNLKIRARQKVAGRWLVSLSGSSSAKRDDENPVLLQQVHQEYHCERLAMIYRLIRTNPPAFLACIK